MKRLIILLLLLLFAAPLYGEQALVHTEIEKLQEKIWYLQRDLAAQKASYDTQAKQLKSISARLNDQQDKISEQLDKLSGAMATGREATAITEGKVQQLHEALSELGESVAGKDKTILEMNSKLGQLEGSLQALRSELTAQQKRHEQTMADVRGQLVDMNEKLESLQRDSAGEIEKLALWGGAAVLGIAIILSVIFALGGSRRGKAREQKPPTRHEL